MSTIKVTWGCGHESFYDARERTTRTPTEMRKWAKDKACPVCYRDALRAARKKIQAREEGITVP